ncbi:MAG: DUF4258 domain-containing protein [Thermosediminibacteraceae bacterium]|uniref:Uncharacterized protein DUF4258 n=1 Tax=Thermosediminibacter litoriperuensis TaxID=291989 RepID=A0A5S5AVC5_9FIRM|nr:DUF4258 domain-containing protein [Thermosediminibacter litoriperuensis]MCG0275664.1 DUF4258 domain-containing protein [Thermosediminibacteraceae bacterium]TYP56846.1 uncharacterized protein DUF4258 [Thermosediminibacter litoriperuensis]
MGEFDIKIIKKLILKGKWLLSDHALERLIERNLKVVDVLTSILNGEILEDYPEDPRGHSVLILGRKDETYIHTVCGLKDDYLIIITAYIPEPPKWVDERTRGGK